MSAPPAHAALLLGVLATPARAAQLDDAAWDLLLRTARAARLHGVLAARLAPMGVALPPVAQRLLTAAANEAAFRRQKSLHLLHTVARSLDGLAPLVLLKGVAYIAQNLAVADGRMPSDVDLLLPQPLLAEAEQRLAAAGWESAKTDDYDQNYYRAWSHELPPLQCAGQALELDLHHTIVPPIGRARADDAALLAASVPAADGRFRVLCPEDQVIHAAAHLFHDGDCVNRLHELVDLDGLLRAHGAGSEAFFEQLRDRARRHQLQHATWHALRFAHEWLRTPLPPGAIAAWQLDAPRPAQRAVVALAAKALAPRHPAAVAVEPLPQQVRVALLRVRWQWLRMPLHLLAYHAVATLLRGLGRATGWRRERNDSSQQPAG
jgi:hypothetical protein